MDKYNPIKGVPKNHYYIREIVVFGDFECPQEERITYVSQNREELVNFCKGNNWAYQDGIAWQTHFIEYRGD